MCRRECVSFPSNGVRQLSGDQKEAQLELPGTEQPVAFVKNIDDVLTTEPISTWSLLIELGFTFGGSIVGSVSLNFDFGNFQLQAIRCMNQWFTDCVLFTGCLVTPRTLAQIEFSLHTSVKSRGDGLRLLSSQLDSYKPENVPPWLEEGRQLRLLDRALWRARPQCYVARNWARLALNSLVQNLASVEEDNATITFRFDGSILTIYCWGEVIATSAQGEPWTQTHSVTVEKLRKLPKRLMNDRIEFSIWESHLTIDRRRYSGVISESE